MHHRGGRCPVAIVRRPFAVVNFTRELPVFQDAVDHDWMMVLKVRNWSSNPDAGCLMKLASCI